MESKRTDVKRVMISSTARDLPEHRKQIMDACLRQSMLPVMMEHLPASDLDAIAASLKMVDEADIYLGVYAFRYGYVPKDGNPNQISVTEMEYRRARERGIPRLIFIMDDEHPVTRGDVETGPGEEKLRQLKEKVGLENILNFFKSHEELRSLVINSLSQLPKGDKSHQFHYVHPIPAPPEPYIAHPYTLLQARGLFGRQEELNLLTDWITSKEPLASVRIFNVIAIGGMGKSALTWHWFENVAPLEMPNLAGRFWWSFYESDAYFENFVIRALAYVSRRSIEEAKAINVVDREAELLRILDREPHLLVLDGLERILIAYARMDAAHLVDDEYDERTANFMAQARGLNDAEKETFLAGHRLRKTADPRAGNFLRKLTRVGASRILVSSRLYPFDLQMVTGDSMPGCHAEFLKGLNDNDALDLWRNFGVSGQRDELLKLFRTFENHPLLLQALAGEIARYRPAPADFDRWRKDKPDFDPFSLPLKQAKSHVLFYSMLGLSQIEQKVLHTIAVFRMPAQYETLEAILIGKRKLCADEEALDALLSELEDRGLVGWDRRANRYDLHPVVRGVVYNKMGLTRKQKVYSQINDYFLDQNMVDENDIVSFEDLASDIEFCFTLIGLRKHDDAFAYFMVRLYKLIYFRFGINRLAVEFLECMFPDGLDQPSKLANVQMQYTLFHHLALSYKEIGLLTKSSFFAEKIIKNFDINNNDQIKLASTLCNLSVALNAQGYLRRAEATGRQSLDILENENALFEESVALLWLGTSLASAGRTDDSIALLKRSQQNFNSLNNKQSEGVVNSSLSQRALWFSLPTEALTFANQAWKLANRKQHEADFIRAGCRQGQALLALGELDAADERLHHALARARAINFVEEELPALIALAELRRRQGRTEEAHQPLDDVWEAAERGPYRLLHADACNVLCQIERDAGNTEKAIEAAEKAYRLAWCDGPPWAYHYGLENAKNHLKELGAAEPDMPENRVEEE